jgi:Ca2+-binding EF-hand superfamily protein
MKKSDLTTLLTAATLFLSFVVLNATAQNDNQGGPKGNFSPERHAAMMKLADTNGDGQVDDAERAAMKAKRRDKMAQNPRFLKRADTDGDGEISDAEFTVAQKKARKMRAERRGDKRRGDRAKADPKVVRAYMVGKYDTDGDKKLDRKERATMRAGVEKEMRAKAEEHLQRLNAVDVNQDGKYSDEEWEAAKKEMMKDGPRRGGPGMHRGN